MARVAQIGIAVGALGAVLTLMSLFPGVTGLDPTPGMGIIQIFGVLIGLHLLILGALFYVKFAFFHNRSATLMQQIGIRLALTGLVLGTMASLADPLGFGSHGASAGTDDLFGELQAASIIGSYFMACIGVLVYAITGEH